MRIYLYVYKVNVKMNCVTLSLYLLTFYCFSCNCCRVKLSYLQKIKYFFLSSGTHCVIHAIHTFYLFNLILFILTELRAHFVPESITSGSGKQLKLGDVGGVLTFVGGIWISCIGHTVQGP